MKNPLLILLLTLIVASCETSEEKAWDQKTINDASRMKKVLDSGVNPNLEKGAANKRFLLQEATERHRVDTVKVLLDRGADPNKKTWGTQKTCLFLAAYSGNLKIAQALIDAKADVNATDMFGNNALREAIGMKRTKMVELLLKNGANPLLRNKDGETMLDLAKKHGTPEIVALMEAPAEPVAPSGGEKPSN